jgi:hypothetical protein
MGDFDLERIFIVLVEIMNIIHSSASEELSGSSREGERGGRVSLIFCP